MKTCYSGVTDLNRENLRYAIMAVFTLDILAQQIVNKGNGAAYYLQMK